MSNALVVLVILSAASPMLEGQSNPAPRSPAGFGVLRPAQSNPYRKLFEPRKAVQQPSPPNQGATKPKVVCGMMVVPADPKHDPSMVLQPKADGIDYTIRAIDPPICSVPR
jgi:hypothetical protein